MHALVIVNSGVNFIQTQQFEFPNNVANASSPNRTSVPPCSGQSRPSPSGGREDAASLDWPCARRLRDLAVGMEECSQRGSNQRIDPKRARKPAISNGWFKLISDSTVMHFYSGQLMHFYPGVDTCHNAADSTPGLLPKSSVVQTTFVPSRKAESQLPPGGTSPFRSPFTGAVFLAMN